MEEKLKDILVDNIKNINRYENQQKILLDTIMFCEQHKFNEEVRIARLKFNEINLIIYDYRNMIKQIESLLTDKAN